MRASDRAYQQLRDEIVDGRLTPDTVLGEVEQSERLGVSRTPLREALSRLMADGLAAQAGGRGTVVSSISLDDVDQLFEVRIPLEVQAARLAAARACPSVFSALAAQFAEAAESSETSYSSDYYSLTRALDEALDAAVANQYLSTALKSLRVHLVRIRRLARDHPDRLRASAEEHRSICEAVAAGDPELAEAATLMHLRRSLAHIKTYTHDPHPLEERTLVI
ncbi:GntR family transcriptional regulator [Nesterenkonia aerolata]|uniref:GntR family transcriptional regulator n=1 Tax=Nesterenkonia aerolata TaxID=3074079 RepID=A0ABU2DUU4_9MICC|nr:GntR family transcriptional regulator [Nesterenkonia sp. LY-0111]MDR8020268.1 GntR family transcriptional regulator [Nesterenkonia sp. LY-0111]